MRHDVLRTVRPDSVSDLHRYPAERPHGRPFRAWRDVSGVVGPTLAHPDHEKGGAHPSGTFAGSGIASPGSSDLASTSIVRFFTFGLGRPSRPARFPVQTDGQFMGLAQRDHDLLEDVAGHDILQRLPRDSPVRARDRPVCRRSCRTSPRRTRLSPPRNRRSLCRPGRRRRSRSWRGSAGWSGRPGVPGARP